MYICYYYSGLISLLEYKAIKYFYFCFANYTEFNRCTWQLYYTYVIQFKKWYFFSYFTSNLCCFVCHVLLLFVILGWKPSTCMLFQFVFKPIYITKCVQTEQNGRPRGHTSHLGQKSYRSSTFKSNTKYMENWVK